MSIVIIEPEVITLSDDSNASVIVLDFESSIKPNEGVPVPKCVYVGKEVFYRDQKIGSGGFGVVYTMTSDHGAKIALKTQKELTENNIEAFKNEVVVWRRLRHKNIITFLGQETDHFNGFHYLKMEYAGHGDLFNFIEKHRDRIPPAFKHHIACQLIAAVTYMHESGFVHCDIKPENVLFTDLATVKVCDFGLARSIRRDKNLVEKKCHIRTGTQIYFTPEKYYGTPSLSTKDDVWALGMTLLYMAIGHCPWNAAAVDDKHYKLWKRNPLRRSKYARVAVSDPAFYKLVTNMLHKDERTRWSMGQANWSYYVRESYPNEGYYGTKQCLKRKHIEASIGTEHKKIRVVEVS
ncbi:hypothetical protein QR680_011296 [Steinernema hermaphroditum]|uniref:mitogen-activated protein kinase kinase n=1 Tax=Steinernema hermaphroditum TaxID=289476 RepID=A0AA39IRT2_9BILA|nr:hypothetical protein QR680_011296 [Steinernema hermaphroditum]